MCVGSVSSNTVGIGWSSKTHRCQRWSMCVCSNRQRNGRVNLYLKITEVTVHGKCSVTSPLKSPAVASAVESTITHSDYDVACLRRCHLSVEKNTILDNSPSSAVGALWITAIGSRGGSQIVVVVTNTSVIVMNVMLTAGDRSAAHRSTDSECDGSKLRIDFAEFRYKVISFVMPVDTSISGWFLVFVSKQMASGNPDGQQTKFRCGTN